MRPGPLLVFALAVAFAAPARAQQPTVIPLGHPTTTMRTVRVAIAGDSVDFLFDTGGGVTVISPEIAAKVGCTPGGRGIGFRMTGQMLAGPYCRNVSLGIGGLALVDDAGVMDFATILGPKAPRVGGMISLSTFRGRALTLDLAQERLIVETPKTLPERVRGMTPITSRLATGPNGAELTAFIGIPAGTTMLWMEWDSENNAPTFLAPHAAKLLGMDSTGRGDVQLTLASNARPTVAAMAKDIIHDGVLSGRFLERATWSIDLTTGRMWMGPVAPRP